MENMVEMCGFRAFPRPRKQPGIQIENTHGTILNTMVEEMASSNFDLRTIDSYVNSMESFLEMVESPGKEEIGKFISPQTLTTLRFFFRQVLKATFPQSIEGAIVE